MRVAFLLAALLAPPSPGLAAGSVRGTITVTGPVPAHARSGADPARPLHAPPLVVGGMAIESCGPGPDESLVIGPERGLGACVVSLAEAPSIAVFRATTAPEVVLDQIGCRFVPHVLAVGRSRPLRIRSSDPVIHSAHAYSMRGRRDRFNLGFPAGGGERVVYETLPGPLTIRCDAGHPWMSAFVYVAKGDNFTVTDASGRFEMAGLAPGKRRLALWHELLGEVFLVVDVPGEGAAEIRASAGFTPAPAWVEVLGGIRVEP